MKLDEIMVLIEEHGTIVAAAAHLGITPGALRMRRNRLTNERPGPRDGVTVSAHVASTTRDALDQRARDLGIKRSALIANYITRGLANDEAASD